MQCTAFKPLPLFFALGLLACGEERLMTAPSSPLCTAGETRACFLGDPALEGVGQCQRGAQTCSVDGTAAWGECTGSGAPGVEVCDQADNDCDGQTDEGLDCPPPVIPPNACQPYVGGCGATDISAGGTFTGTTCGMANVFNPRCNVPGTPEVLFHVPDLPTTGIKGLSFEISDGFFYSHVANDLRSCRDAVFAPDAQLCRGNGVQWAISSECGQWFIVEKLGGGCGEFTLKVVRGL